MPSKEKNTKSLAILVVLNVLLMSLVSCMRAGSIKPKEPAHIEYGIAGESPKEVTKVYNWTCFDNDRYREISR